MTEDAVIFGVGKTANPFFFESIKKAVVYTNRNMVELARSVGASAKFTGSGGAIIGTYRDNVMFKRLSQLLREHDIEVIKPRIVRTGGQA